MEKQENNKKKINNPHGKGGFTDNPDHINKNGRPKNDFSITYWMKEYLAQAEPGHEKERYKELAELICVKAAHGDRHFTKLVLDRVDGAVPLEVKVDNKELQNLANTLMDIYKLDKKDDDSEQPISS